MLNPGATQPNSVLSRDFVRAWFTNGKAPRLPSALDEHTRERLGLEVARSIEHQHVIPILSRLMRLRGRRAFIRSDHSTEFAADPVIG